MIINIRMYCLMVLLAASSSANCMSSRASGIAAGALGVFMFNQMHTHTGEIISMQGDVRRLERNLKKAEERLDNLEGENRGLRKDILILSRKSHEYPIN